MSSKDEMELTEDGAIMVDTDADVDVAVVVTGVPCGTETTGAERCGGGKRS